MGDPRGNVAPATVRISMYLTIYTDIIVYSPDVRFSGFEGSRPAAPPRHRSRTRSRSHRRFGSDAGAPAGQGRFDPHRSRSLCAARAGGDRIRPTRPDRDAVPERGLLSAHGAADPRTHHPVTSRDLARGRLSLARAGAGLPTAAGDAVLGPLAGARTAPDRRRRQHPGDLGREDRRRLLQVPQQGRR